MLYDKCSFALEEAKSQDELRVFQPDIHLVIPQVEDATPSRALAVDSDAKAAKIKGRLTVSF